MVSAPPVPPLRPPSAITPAKVSLALVRVSAWPPSATVPLPDRLVIDAPDVVPEMSNAPLAATALALIDPAPANARVAPVSIVVSPVYVFTPDRTSTPPACSRLPLPEITPAKVPPPVLTSAALSRTLPPSAPPPDKPLIAWL